VKLQTYCIMKNSYSTVVQ